MQQPAYPCLSVVMPAYNEENTLERCVDRVLASPWTQQLLIINDGSGDRTDEIALKLQQLHPQITYISQPHNMGKGAALRTGFEHATSEYVVVQDADLEYNPEEFGLLLEPLLSGNADVVFGSRFLAGRPHRVLYFWHSVGNKFLTLMSNMFTNLNLTDMETCYKACRLEVVRSVEICENRFGFEPEFTAKVAAGGWRIYEVGVSYDGRTYEDGKKIGVKDGFRAIYCILKYSKVARRKELRQ